MAQVYIEKAYATYKLGMTDKAEDILLIDAKKACPLEDELFDEEWDILTDEE